MKNRILFLLPLLLGSCAKKSHSSRSKKEAPLKYRKLFVEGVECKYCAQAAVSRLEKINGVKRADFVCKGDKWEQGHVRLFSLEEIPDELINQELAKEDFHIR
jgi:hypothetical protein